MTPLEIDKQNLITAVELGLYTPVEAWEIWKEKVNHE